MRVLWNKFDQGYTVRALNRLSQENNQLSQLRSQLSKRGTATPQLLHHNAGRSSERQKSPKPAQTRKP